MLSRPETLAKRNAAPIALVSGARSARHPEVVPADHDEDRRHQVGGVAEHLERQLAQERADAAGEV